ncbi:unannotated protein [freshwater metagenome]|uniref:Unannotated protein n=1 Tax=freshwater metagenome TaxID=449393 RepID=A0A6J6Q4P5_9ZZZZ
MLRPHFRKRGLASATSLTHVLLHRYCANFFQKTTHQNQFQILQEPSFDLPTVLCMPAHETQLIALHQANSILTYLHRLPLWLNPQCMHLDIHFQVWVDQVPTHELMHRKDPSDSRDHLYKTPVSPMRRLLLKLVLAHHQLLPNVCDLNAMVQLD